MGVGSEGYFENPHRQTGLVCLIWAGPHMVTTPLVKCVIWFEIALVCKWLSQLHVAARLLNAGFSERQSHNGTSFLVSQNIFLLFQQRESGTLVSGNVGYGDMQKNLSTVLSMKNSTILTD